MERSLRETFDDVPERYERARPGYPDELLDDLLELARLRPGDRVVEVGPGTGKATLALAVRGLRVTAVELGPALAAFAAGRLAAFPAVEVVNADFETWRPGRAGYDAVAAFTAFHWISPGERYARAAALLRDGGALALVAVHHVLPPGADPFFLVAQEDYDAVGAGGAPPGPPEAVEGFGAEIAASGHFLLVAERRYRWDVEYTADAYIDVIGTYSGNIALSEATRRALFDRLRARIGERTVRKTYLATLEVARRR